MPKSRGLLQQVYIKAGVPVEANVDAIFLPICPDLPIPQTIIALHFNID